MNSGGNIKFNRGHYKNSLHNKVCVPASLQKIRSVQKIVIRLDRVVKRRFRRLRISRFINKFRHRCMIVVANPRLLYNPQVILMGKFKLLCGDRIVGDKRSQNMTRKEWVRQFYRMRKAGWFVINFIRHRIFKRKRSLDLFTKTNVNYIVSRCVEQLVRQKVGGVRRIRRHVVRTYRLFFRRKLGRSLFQNDYRSRRVWRRMGSFYGRKVGRFLEICERYTREVLAVIESGIGAMKLRSYKFRSKRDVIGSRRFGQAKCWSLVLRPVRLTELLGVVINSSMRQLSGLLNRFKYLRQMLRLKVGSMGVECGIRSVGFGLLSRQLKQTFIVGRLLSLKKRRIRLPVRFAAKLLCIDVRPTRNNFIAVITQPGAGGVSKTIGRFSYGLFGLRGKKVKRRSSAIKQLIGRLFKFLLFLKKKERMRYKIKRPRHQIKLVLRPFVTARLTKKFLRIFMALVRKYNKGRRRKRNYKRSRFNFRRYRRIGRLKRIHARFGLQVDWIKLFWQGHRRRMNRRFYQNRKR